MANFLAGVFVLMAAVHAVFEYPWHTLGALAALVAVLAVLEALFGRWR